MKHKLLHPILSCLGIWLILSAAPLWAQDVPGDLEVVVTSGGIDSGDEYSTIRITSDGQASFNQFVPDDPAAPPILSNTFTITPTEVGQVWQAIQDNDFFSLPAEQIAPSIEDGSFVQISVTGNGNSHTVTAENISVAQVDAILAVINGLTPNEDDLVYVVADPFSFDPRDICEVDGNKQTVRYSKRIDKETGERFEEVIIPGKRQLNGGAHAGSVVGYRFSLQEAVDRGIVTLSAKGDIFFGDAVSIDIDNTGNETNDRLSLSLYLELWGPEAGPNWAQIVENAIESEWGGKMTSDGKTMDVDVITRVAPGATSAPGTAGYHQIKLVEKGTSGVNGRGTTFDVNTGVGSGTWRTTGNLLEEMYAHEAGHLFGFPDRYDDYRKQSDGKWKLKGSDETFTSEELAMKITPQYPGRTETDVKNWLDSDIRRVTPSRPGFEDDIMGNKKKDVQQADVDALAGEAGIIIELRAGDVLLNKDGSGQNFLVTRSEDIFVPAGETKTLEGVYAACIDLDKDIPAQGSGFDVAPSLAQWHDIAAASVLQQLVDYIDQDEAFCGGDLIPQYAIWRISDNDDIGDPEIDAYLAEAGLDLGDQFYDFPRMSNTNAGDPASATQTPAELLVPVITVPNGRLQGPGVDVTLTGSINFDVEGLSSSYTWTLIPTPGSAASLLANQGNSTSFFADMRGLYRVILEAEVSTPELNPVTVEKRMLLSFADTGTETFESGMLRNGRPFFWETVGSNPWEITSGATNTGSFALGSPDIGNNETAGLSATFTQVADGPILFAFKVSSEENYDFFRVIIDGVDQAIVSGELDWSGLWIPLAAGEHTVTWVYEKDGSHSEGADRAWIDDVFFPETAVFTAVEPTEAEGLPRTYQLLPNYPNPFHPSTTITYALPEPGHVTLTVYDALGRQVTQLVNETQDPGWHRIPFDAGGYSNGVYYYVLRAGTYEAKRAMILTR